MRSPDSPACMIGPTGGPTTPMHSRRSCTPAYVGRFSWVLFYSRPLIRRLQRLKHVYLLGPCVVSGRHRASLTLCASGRSLGYSLGVTARAHSSLAVPVHDPSRSSRLSGRSMDSRPALLARDPPYALACSLALSGRRPCVSGSCRVGTSRTSRRPKPFHPMRRYAPTRSRPPARRPRASRARACHR